MLLLRRILSFKGKFLPCRLKVSLVRQNLMFWFNYHLYNFFSVNHTSWMAVVTPTDRPKSVRNRCLIELFRGVVCVATLQFWHFCWCRGFCHRTESDLLFVSIIHLYWSMILHMRAICVYSVSCSFKYTRVYLMNMGQQKWTSRLMLSQGCTHHSTGHIEYVFTGVWVYDTL